MFAHKQMSGQGSEYTFLIRLSRYTRPTYNKFMVLHISQSENMCLPCISTLWRTHTSPTSQIVVHDYVSVSDFISVSSRSCPPLTDRIVMGIDYPPSLKFDLRHDRHMLYVPIYLYVFIFWKTGYPTYV